MTKHSDVIELMSPEHDLPNELVINLASPQRPGEMCNQDGVQVDSNNLLAQLPTQSGSQDAQDYQQVDALRVARKRMWGEMDGAEQQQRVAGHMQWGSTGPRMQRSRTAVLQAAQVDRQASGGSDDAVAATPVPHQSATHAGRRRLTIVPRKQQLQAAAAGAESPAIVIDDDSPVPTRQQQRISSGVGSRPAPIAIRGNPGYASRVAAAAAAAPATQRPRRRMRANVVWDLAAQVGPAARGAARASREEHGGSSSDDAEIARRVQEEEDADMARRMMQEEQMRAQTEAAERHRRRMELMRQIEAEEAAAEAATAAAMAAAAAAQAGSPGRARGRRGGRAPQRAEHHQQQHEAHQQPHQHNPHWGMAMAHALLQLPRWGGGRGRGLPPGLSAMREAVLGMQAAGLPPHLLFSDRDFGADDYDMLLRLDDTVEKKGAESSAINALPTQTVPAGGITGAAGEKLSCAVCLEEYVEGAELRTLPCLHKFHKGCIDKWLGVKAACPVCNRECK